MWPWKHGGIFIVGPLFPRPIRNAAMTIAIGFLCNSLPAAEKRADTFAADRKPTMMITKIDE